MALARFTILGLTGVSWAIGGSVCAHGVALAVGLRLASARPAAAPPERLIDIDVAANVAPTAAPLTVASPPPEAIEPPALPAAVAHVKAPSTVSAPQATPTARDERTAPSAAPAKTGDAAATPVEAAPALTADEGMPSFDLPSGQGSGQAHGAVATTGTSHVEASDGPISEHAVSTPARIVRGGKPPYPPGALADGVEGDVVFELIVSASGAVESARVTKGLGHGLDEAATNAVRGYRFSAATKDGHAVRVRMRWAVQFRLE